MAITVTHTKVSTIPDSGDASLIEPSDWNATHQLSGTVPVVNGGTGASTLTGYVKGNGTSTMTASSTIPNTDITGLGTASTKDAGVANGVATLDSSGQVPLSQIPPLGDLNYQGTWNATTNTPTLTSSVGTKGYYYVVSVAGTTNLNGITDWQINDWAVFNGSVWQKIDNTDSVTSVNGKTGTVVLTNTDISGFGTMSTQNANAVAITGGTIDGTTIGGTTPAVITGSTINANTKVVSPDYYAQSVLGGNLRTSGGTSLVNWDGGGSGNVTINGGLLANASNKNVSLAPTGTGTVTVNPATAGAMDNMVIGATTPKAITGTTITATTFSGSGASLTSIPNSALNNSSITINGNATALGGSVSVGTVTSVAATAGTGISVTGSPITSNGILNITNTAPDQTVVLTAGTGISTSGTYPNFTITNTSPSSGGTVTSVSGTAGRITSTGGNTPVIDLASGVATAGTTGSSTLIPVVTIDTYGRVTGITTAANPQGTVTSVTGTAPVVSSGGATPAISMAAANTTTNGYLTSTDWNTFNGKGSGTVTSVTATSPVTSTGGTTPVIAMPAATTSVSGYLTSTDWNTFNGKGSGTVTSVAALTLGTTGIDLSSTVATGTTTPVITLQVPTASATNRGALSSADWSTFNGKQAALVSGTNIKTVSGVSLLGSGDVGLIGATYGGTGVNNGSNTITIAGNLTHAGAFTQSFTATANTAVTLPAGATASSNNLLSSATAVGIVTGTPSSSTYLRGDGTWSSVSATTANNLAGGALGSVPYQLLSGSTTFLAGNTTTTPQFLTSTGVAGIATAPTYTGSTGSGNVVLATSPTLVTPALGTPASGVVTNLTGTASININGTVGATTANTGAFTTLSASSTVSGTGFSTYLASPPAIGGTAAAAITGTTITATNFVGVSGGTF